MHGRASQKNIMKKTFYIILITILFALNSCMETDLNKKEMNNILLTEFTTPYGVPPFDKISESDYIPAFNEAMKLHNEEIKNIVENPDEPTFENTIVALKNSGELLNQVSSIFFNLTETMSDDTMQQIAVEISPVLSKHGDDISMNDALFQRIKSVWDNRQNFNLNTEDSMLLAKTYEEFVRNGALLDDTQKEELKEINQKLSVLALQFGNNVLAETNQFKLVIDNKDDLAGLPDDVINAATETAIATGDSGKWVFTIQKPSLIPFLTYSEKRNLREQMFKAYISKGDHNDSLDNKSNINEIVNLRLKKAKLLGFNSWAEYQLDDRMAKTPENVYNLLNDVWAYALPATIKEAEKLQQMINAEGNNFDLQPWDWWYYSEKLRSQDYDLDENQLRPYFKLENVVDGIFYVANRLYGLKFIQNDNLPKYHPDVIAYEVWQGDDSIMGVLYMDFFPRDSKRGGAWMTEFRPEHYSDGKRIIPVISVVTNFTKPTGDKPSLLSLDEVETIFHEFGHSLHGLLANTKYHSLSGTNVALDFVEMPSQIMEKWAVQPEVLRYYAKHYETGEIIPDELIEKITNAGYFNQGFTTLEYMAAAFLDMDWHNIKEEKNYDVNAFEDSAMNAINLIPQVVVRYRSTYFNHVFSGGYSTGYYAYIWADVIVSDAFDYFKENGIFNQDIALKFRHILESGGTIPPMELYEQFRGHSPSVEPLLKDRGFIK